MHGIIGQDNHKYMEFNRKTLRFLPLYQVRKSNIVGGSIFLSSAENLYFNDVMTLIVSYLSEIFHKQMSTSKD